MAAALFRDTTAGQILRLVGYKVSPYIDERDDFEFPNPRSITEHEKPHERSNSGVPIESEAGKDNSVSDFKPEGPESDLEREAQRQRPPAPIDPDLVDWYGPDDIENPQNWSTAKKTFTFAQICLLTFSIYSASAIITPAQPVFVEIWGVSQQLSSLALSMYVLGYGVGPLIFSPMSEIPDVGRNVAYLSSFFIFIVLTAIGSRVSNFPGFIVIRFLQGFFGGPVLATGAASAQDLTSFSKVPYFLSCWAVFGYSGPALGPLLSGFAVSLSTWRWAMYETLILCGFTFLVLFFFLPETNAEFFLTKRAQRLRAKTGNQNLKTKAELHAGNKNWIKLTMYHFTMPFKIAALDPSVLFIHLYTALVYGVYYSFFESFPIVYIQMYGFSIGIMGVVFISVLIGGLIGLGVYTLLVWSIYEPYTLSQGIGSPEYRLVPGIFAAALAPAGMFIFGYASRPDITWVAPTVGIALYAATSFILVNVIFVYLPISYPRYAASVFAANGFFRSAMACGAIHFSQPLFHNLGVGDGCALLGSLAAGCAILFVALWHYGPKLRARSRFAETY